MTVLLVEDDHLVRDTVASGLQERGFDVQAESSGHGAWLAFEADPERFTAIVVDVELPGEDPGDQVAYRIQQLRPTLPIVVTSGRMSSLIEAQRVQDGRARMRSASGGETARLNVEYLVKPYTLDGLARTLRRQLDRDGSDHAASR